MKKILTTLALITGSAMLANAAVILTDDFSTLDAWTIDVNADAVGGDLSITSDGSALLAHEVASAVGTENLGTITRTIDASGHTGITLDLDAWQHNPGSFEGTEYLDISIDTGSGYVSLLQDFGELGVDVAGVGTGLINPITALALLGADNSSFDLQISFYTGFWGATAAAREEYSIDNLVINGNVIPEPATLGMVAAFGGGILFIRRKLMM